MLGSVTVDDLGVLLKTAFMIDHPILADMVKAKYGGGATFTDRNYSLTSVQQAHRFCVQNRNIAYSYEGHDCDNFAAQLWGMWSQGNCSFVFGYAQSINHAFNFMVDENLNIYIVEPMTNQFISFETIRSGDNATYKPLIFIV